VDWKKSFQLASVYVGSVVGAGFATGKEIVEFFSQYGLYGLFGIILAGLGFIYFGVKVMEMAIRLNAKSYEELTMYLFSPIFAPIINIFMFLMLIGASSVMLSGAGSVFEEHLNIPREMGILFTIGLSLIVLMVGTKGLVIVNLLVVPLLILFNLFLAFLSMQLPEFYSNVQALGSTNWKWFLSAFSYVAFNITLTQAILVPAANEIGDVKVVKAGGIIGGLLLTLILITSHMTLVQLPNLTSYHIPMAMIMHELAKSLYLFFILIIYGEIFTSIIGNIYGLERFLKKWLPFKTIFVGILIFSVTYLISKIDYSTLLSTLYPLFGYISLVFLVLLIIRK